MTHEDVRLEITGFDANSSFERYLKSVIYDLHMEAPSDSTTTASFTKFGSTVSAAVQISSSQGVFSADRRGTDACSVARDVVQDLRRQLRAWKHLRFKNHRYSPDHHATIP